MGALNDLGDIVSDFSEMTSFSDGAAVLDQMMRLAMKILGQARARALLQPYCEALVEPLKGHLEALGAPEEATELLASTVPGLAQYMLGTGMRSLANDMMAMTNVSDLSSLTEQLRA